MKVLVIGGGPSGLLAAWLLRTKNLASDVVVLEQNPKDATFGFGITLIDHAIDELIAAAPAIGREVRKAMISVRGHLIEHPQGLVDVDMAVSAGSIERLAMLQIFQRHCESVGVDVRYGTRANKAEVIASDYDLIIGADGANSVVREWFANEFKPASRLLSNHFAWYGLNVPYERATLSFRQAFGGCFCGHYYRYTPAMSTFVGECDEAAWLSGFGALTDDGRTAAIEELFADVMQGHSLVAQRSHWRPFNAVECESWIAGKTVLLGDAGHTAHFSIGSGTRLALGDALALIGHLQSGHSLEKSLENFDRERRAQKSKLTRAARASYEWYDGMGRRIASSPVEFAYEYVTRTGRVDDDRLRQLAPRFADQVLGAAS
jgi:2-polyprenyl-6-methoxyphenol hydroxylase-like FAD-dependent oxidoreductase